MRSMPAETMTSREGSQVWPFLRIVVLALLGTLLFETWTAVGLEDQTRVALTALALGILLMFVVCEGLMRRLQ